MRCIVPFNFVVARLQELLRRPTFSVAPEKVGKKRRWRRGARSASAQRQVPESGIAATTRKSPFRIGLRAACMDTTRSNDSRCRRMTQANRLWCEWQRVTYLPVDLHCTDKPEKKRYLLRYNPSGSAYALPPPFAQGRLWCIQYSDYRAESKFASGYRLLRAVHSTAPKIIGILPNLRPNRAFKKIPRASAPINVSSASFLPILFWQDRKEWAAGGTVAALPHSLAAQ